MKKVSKKVAMFIPMLLLSVAILCSCSKDENNAAANPTPANGSFTWTTNGTATVNTADSAFYRAAFKTIFAYKKISGVMKLQYEINLTAGTPATYTIGGGNAITYTANTPFFVPTAGSVIITANTGTKVTGTFTGTGTLTAGTNAVAGTFTDIPVQ